jgi:hypothetical protein
MNEKPTYTIPADVLQAIVQTLEELPAKQTRHLLNFIEHTTKEQDQARKEKAE